MNKIGIIGSGPTGIYTLLRLARSIMPLDITIFEAESVAGKGMPYHPAVNDAAMLSNIASIELPPVEESLVVWLSRQSDESLTRMGIARTAINDREFYPRVVLGEYFEHQFYRLIDVARRHGHALTVLTGHRVTDIELRPDDVKLVVSCPESRTQVYAFDHVVMATGHSWPDNTQIKPGYFISPWPAESLAAIGDCSVGVLGTSLSGIDTVVALATRHGAFYAGADGQLDYQPAEGSDAFRLTMMSRKGLLPEADFFCPIPYLPHSICTDEAMDDLLTSGRPDLLDAAFELFKQELAACDPDYASSIGLSLLMLENLSEAYFARRRDAEPFLWAALNLAEAKNNAAKAYTVPWRYAILRMHEVVARVVPALDEEDLKRFHIHFKPIFVDNYATVPHESIERLLALRRAGKLDILKLEDNYDIRTDEVESGACIATGDRSVEFQALIDATGQHNLDAADIPFPTLVRQGVARRAATGAAAPVFEFSTKAQQIETGGVDLDSAFRLKFDLPLSNKLYCVALSFLLHKFPFVQGLASAHELGGIVSSAILESIAAASDAMPPQALQSMTGSETVSGVICN